MMRRIRTTLLLLTVAATALWTAAPSAQRRPTLSSDLASHARGAHGRHRVIVQADPSAIVNLRIRGLGLFRGSVDGAAVLDVTDEQLEALTRDSSVAHISGDLPVFANLVDTNRITQADDVWQGTRGFLGLFSKPGYTGKGIGVAVLDSGIAAHSALENRVVAHVNFVSTEPWGSGDPFGHGTHIAGIVGGDGDYSATSVYSGGSAPDVRLIDVRVLGSNGSGLTSDVIAGIDWVIANRTKYNIRLINLSLGHPVTEPSTTDPLCQAVARAVATGITVVTSAGNYGITASGAPVLGGITSPGNSPFAITVAATDAADSVSTYDDSVAPFSSRGPARFEMTVKPDLAAPGTRIVSLEANGSYLSAAYPQYHVAGRRTNAYMRLSGTSMATAVVTGGAALILQAHPSLTPAQLKVVLQMGARYMDQGGLIGAGAGQVNFAQSMKIADDGLLSSLLNTVTSVLGLSSGATFRDSGTMIDGLYNRTGLRLLGILDLGRLLGLADQAEWGVLNLLGLGNPLGYTPANRLVWGEVSGWTSSYYVIWGSAIQAPSGQYVIWGSGDYTDPNYVIWGSSYVADERP